MYKQDVIQTVVIPHIQNNLVLQLMQDTCSVTSARYAIYNKTI